MNFTASSWAMVITLGAAVYALWTNPHRQLNRTVVLASVHLFAWLAIISVALRPMGGASATLMWGAMVGAMLLWQLWLIKEVMLRPEQTWGQRLVRSWPWAVAAFGVGAIVLVLPVSSTALGLAGVIGPGLAVYEGAVFTLFMVIAVKSIWDMRGVQGASRVEIQVVLLGALLVVSMASILVGLGAWLHEPELVRVMPLVVATLCACTLWSIVSIRVLDPAHILSLAVEKVCLVAAVALTVWTVEQFGEAIMPSSVAFVVALTAGLGVSARLSPWLQVVFQRHARANRVRSMAFEIAKDELRPDAMHEAFTSLLKRWAGCERAVILMRSHRRLTGDGVELDAESVEMQALRHIRWATPERMEREVISAGGTELQQTMERHAFGLLATSMGPNPALVIGLGIPMTRRPYTYPEIKELQELAAVIENSLSRAHYLMKVQHAEQLATVGLLGASLAHEIRNPLVSIKTFVQLLPHKYNEQLFRDKFFRLIGDEVGRIDRLTEQLLDLSAPRSFTGRMLNLHPLILACRDLLSAKADDNNVQLVADLGANRDYIFSDPDAIKQVMLNLGFNAIQSLEKHEGERWLRFETREVSDGLELSVIDNGNGFTQEGWSRLFQPFQSTKSSGFGLGLAICKNILTDLQASITADPPHIGRGAIFRIILPCQPPPTS